MAEQTTQTEEIAKSTEVAQAMAQAAAAAPDAEQAVENANAAGRAKRDEVGANLSDEDIEKISDQFVSKAIKAFEDRGAFDPAPEPVRAPTAAPPLPGEEPAALAETQPAPQKKTWAQKFLGE